MSKVVVKRVEIDDPFGLSPGDKIEYGVTHELKINGDSSWVSYKISASVREEESSQDAHERVQKQVDGQLENLIMRTVKFVEAHS